MTRRIPMPQTNKMYMGVATTVMIKTLRLAQAWGHLARHCAIFEVLLLSETSKAIRIAHYPQLYLNKIPKTKQRPSWEGSKVRVGLPDASIVETFSLVEGDIIGAMVQVQPIGHVREYVGSEKGSV